MHLLWDQLADALWLGWATTALFGGIVGAAVAVWARVHPAIGALVGAVTLVVGVGALLSIGIVRWGRARSVTSWPSSDAGAQPASVTARPRPTPSGLDGDDGWGFAVRDPRPVADRWSAALDAAASDGWGDGSASASTSPLIRSEPNEWDLRLGDRRSPGQRGHLNRPRVVVATLVAAVAVGYVVSSLLSWVTVRGLDGSSVVTLGPFTLQVGEFVIGSTVLCLISAVGTVIRPSAWWTVLCAWCATWWIFITVEALTVEGSIDVLSRLVQSTIHDRIGYREEAGISLGPAWMFVLCLNIVLVLLSIGLVVLQHRDTGRSAR